MTDLRLEIDADVAKASAPPAAMCRDRAWFDAIVTRVQRGLRSHLHAHGRQPPSHETGVHRFHRLLAEALDAPR